MLFGRSRLDSGNASTRNRVIQIRVIQEKQGRGRKTASGISWSGTKKGTEKSLFLFGVGTAVPRQEFPAGVIANQYVGKPSIAHNRLLVFGLYGHRI